MDFFKNFSFGEFQWVEIVYAMVGSFVGIFIPLWIDKSRSRKQEKDARMKLIASLNRELDSVKELITEFERPNRQYEIFSFTTFVWDSIISSGMLTDMLADKAIDGTLLMEIYSDLSLLREYHEEFCKHNEQLDSDTIDYLSLMYDRIMQKRREIHEKIMRYQAVPD